MSERKSDDMNVNAFENQIPSTQTAAADNTGAPPPDPRQAPAAEKMPASEAARKADVKDKLAAPKPEKPAPDSFSEKVWKPILWPIVTVVAICIVVSLLLSITYNSTKPLIDANATAAADSARQELLPEADGFEEVDIGEPPEGITSMFKATNDVGYVIEAYSKGYGGSVPAMVAFDADGNIAGVKFLENSETPGLGQKLVTDPTFAAQFTGLPSQQVTGVDKIAAATISTNAGRDAVNAAVAFYNTEVKGETVVELTPEEVRAALLPEATTITRLDVDIKNISEAYKGDDGNYIIYGRAPGMYDVPNYVYAAVAMDEGGTILGIWLDTSAETAGYGQELAHNQAFMDEFVGATATEGLDVVADCTISSKAVFAAVQTALDALEEVKNAPALEGDAPPPVEEEPVPEVPQLTPEEVRATLLPDANEFTELELDIKGVTEAWRGDDGNYIIYARAPGMYDVPNYVYAAVAMDENGVILGIWLNTSAESKGYGQEIAYNEAFLASFVGKTLADIEAGGVDAVADATVTSNAVFQAVKTALGALEQAKGAA